MSARTYAAADELDAWNHARYTKQIALPNAVVNSRTAMFTPHVTITARQLVLSVGYRVDALSEDIERFRNPDYNPELDWRPDAALNTELLIVDEADRLKTTALEQLRDFFDRSDIGMILIGMPGFDRQLARYPQLYSRIGFAHQYRPLDPEDITPVLTHYWQQLGHAIPLPDLAPDTETATAITRITGGNFRLIERLMTQIGRILEINHLDTITTDVVAAARQTLVVGV